ncbi:MAG: 30S ribosomal protein S16 [Candidatus Roizmanbacteria bacterium]
MAATIRLMRFGKKGQPFYRIVVLNKAAKSNGKYIEEIGSYNPLTKPSTVTLKKDRYNYWKSVGAQVSTGVTYLKLSDIK